MKAETAINRLRDSEANLDATRKDMRAKLAASSARTGRVVGAAGLGVVDGALGSVRIGAIDVQASDALAVVGLLWKPRNPYMAGAIGAAQTLSVYKVGVQAGKAIGERTKLRERIEDNVSRLRAANGG